MSIMHSWLDTPKGNVQFGAASLKLPQTALSGPLTSALHHDYMSSLPNLGHACSPLPHQASLACHVARQQQPTGMSTGCPKSASPGRGPTPPAEPRTPSGRPCCHHTQRQNELLLLSGASTLLAPPLGGDCGLRRRRRRAGGARVAGGLQSRGLEHTSWWVRGHRTVRQRAAPDS